MFKYSVEKSAANIFKSPVSKSGDIKGYAKIASNMNGSKVNSMVNGHYQPRKAISESNIKSK